MGLRRFLSLPVAMVLMVIGFVYHTTIFLVIEPWLSLSTGPGMLNAIFFTGLGAMALFCYVLAVIKDPGRIPSSYMPDLEEPGLALHEVKRKGGDLRYCQKCSHYKPPRAHHCRVCKRCVLRMDHHCVWINNCVGHNNYKPFFLFVSYVVAACVHSLVLLLGSAFQDLAYHSEVHSGNGGDMPVSSSIATSTLMKILCAVVLVPLLVAVTVLLAWHVYLLMHNKTTIEYHEGVRAKWLAEKAGHHYRHPYDLGVVKNIVSLLGPTATLWFIPTATSHMGSGLQFRTFYDLSSPADSRSGG